MNLSKISVLAFALTFASIPALAHAATAPLRTKPRYRAPEPAPVVDTAPEPTRTALREHRGFYLRAELGGGYRSLSSQSDGVSLRMDGAGVGASLLAGGTPTPNLILVGELSINGITNPTLHSGDVSAEAKDMSVTVAGFGPGIIYYVMPANLSLGASLLFTRLSLSQAGERVGETELGFGATARVGKEWWLSQRSTFGLGAGFNLASIPDKTEGVSPWLATAFTLSATFSYD